MADFAPVIAFSLAAEGGFVDDQRDPGGATKYGIILEGLSEWRHAVCTVEDVRMLSQAEAVAIYTKNYWLPMRGPEMPAGLDLMVFDFGINVGMECSVKLLQRLVGAREDGRVGPITLAAATGPDALLCSRIAALDKLQLDYYRSLRNYPIFKRGWTARTLSRPGAALALVNALTAREASAPSPPKAGAASAATELIRLNTKETD